MHSSKNNDDVFQAIADPNRRKILEILRDGEKPAGEIVGEFDITFAAISQHLKVLLDTDLVTRRTVGRYRYYSMQPKALLAVHEWTEGFRDFWENRLDRLTEYLDDEP